MAYVMEPLACDPQHVKGMSERLIVSHYENNYGGAVKRLNLIEEQLAGLDFAAVPTFVLNGLKREQLIATNSMILHELFFGNLGEAGEPGPGLREALNRDFGSLERWRAKFVRRDGQGARGRLGMGAAQPLGARRQAREPVGFRPRPHARGRSADPGARHVRALLPPGLRGQGGR